MFSFDRVADLFTPGLTKSRCPVKEAVLCARRSLRVDQKLAGLLGLAWARGGWGRCERGGARNGGGQNELVSPWGRGLSNSLSRVQFLRP
jgi:hypothetical protein